MTYLPPPSSENKKQKKQCQPIPQHYSKPYKPESIKLHFGEEG